MNLTCDDLFTGEVASTGYTCAEYEDNRWCTKSGNEGPEWDASWGALDQMVVASCCACGKAAADAGATNARESLAPLLFAPALRRHCSVRVQTPFLGFQRR